MNQDQLFKLTQSNVRQNEKIVVFGVGGGGGNALNHIIESNCYNDVVELDLTSLTLLIDSGQDTITLVETDTMLPLYPPEKSSTWTKILQS